LLSWIPVLAALQAVQYGPQRPFSHSLVLLEGLRLARQPGDGLREPRSTLRGEHAPAQKAVGALQTRVVPPTLEQLLQRRVQRLRLMQGESEFDRSIAGRANGSSPGRCGPA
jgi:hypothetical protein